MTFRFIILLFLLPLFCPSLLGQYLEVRLMDQLRQKVNEKDSPDRPLLASTKGEFKILNDDEKVDYLYESLRAIALERYDDFFGEPYLLKEFQNAVLRDASGNNYALPNINYNAFTGRMEFKKEEAWVEILPVYFPRVEFATEAANSLLVYGVLPDYPDKYAIIIYKGKKVTAAIQPKVTVVENQGFSAGKHVASKKFSTSPLLYLYVDEKWRPTTYKPKAIAKALGSETEIKAFIKENKLNPKNHADLIRILEFAETL
ncbi:MAG: hypothetical protein AAGF89_13335 [Bacteroidota bacterium]